MAPKDLKKKEREDGTFRKEEGQDTGNQGAGKGIIRSLEKNKTRRKDRHTRRRLISDTGEPLIRRALLLFFSGPAIAFFCCLLSRRALHKGVGEKKVAQKLDREKHKDGPKVKITCEEGTESNRSGRGKDQTTLFFLKKKGGDKDPGKMTPDSVKIE